MSGDPLFLAVADRIGNRLCREAIWAGKACNWLGWQLVEDNGQWKFAMRTQSRRLYDGTPGIALFLAHIFAHTGDETQLETLRGALEHLLAGPADSLPREVGYYNGLAGIASACFSIGEILGDESLIQRGVSLLADIAARAENVDEIDVASGTAGAIPVLLHKAVELDRSDFFEAACKMGKRTLARGVRSDAGVHWSGQTKPLLGYPFGIGGIACALTELYSATREQEYLSAASDALRLEGSLFVASSQNWPHQREGLITPCGLGLDPKNERLPTAWCHGAPSVVCGLLRVGEILRPHAGWNFDAGPLLEAGLNTTAIALAGKKENWVYNLCHGVAGCGDILLKASELFGRENLWAVANALGQEAAERHHTGRRPWPCAAVGFGETPNLMQGLAGIGIFYLRLLNQRKIGSPLFIESQSVVPSQVPELAIVQ